METDKPLDAAPLDKLLNAHRVLGESRMIRTETDPKDLTDQDIQDVIDRIKAYQKEKGAKNAQIARAIMVSPSVISQVLGGTYAADCRPLIVAMDRWLERRKSADDAPELVKFVLTGVARKVRLAAQRAIASADMGLDSRISLVWGDPGCGKTMALEAVAETENAILISCDFHAASEAGLLRKIAAQLKGFSSMSGWQAFEKIKQRLHGSGKLIIVDEIHALLQAKNDNPFHMLRRLSDETGCPQLWSASCDLISELRKREQRREPLAQIIRRVGTQFHLTAAIAGNGDDGQPLCSVEEIIQIFGRGEMRLSKDAARFLARICASPRSGLLGTCASLVGHAIAMNRRNADTLTAEMLWEAAQVTMQASEIETMYDSVHEELPSRRRMTAAG
jgi:DNA transposition AAA+ family ATPase